MITMEGLIYITQTQEGVMYFLELKDSMVPPYLLILPIYIIF